MTPTNVGMRCPECAKQRTKVVRLRDAARTPRVTYALIAINVLVYLAEKKQFTATGQATGAIVRNGQLYREGIAVHHDYWQLLSNAFIHENIFHIGFNMYLLYVLGMMLEPAVGSLRFGVVYFTSLFVGSFGVILSTATGSIGASGAIFGLAGYAAVELRARGHRVMETGIGALIIINLVWTFLMPGISIGAHIGGLIGGIIAGVAMKLGDERRMRWLGLAACLALSVAAIAGSIALAGVSGGGFA
jgi:membrane associated rhomboid family serine protease